VEGSEIIAGLPGFLFQEAAEFAVKAGISAPLTEKSEAPYPGSKAEGNNQRAPPRHRGLAERSNGCIYLIGCCSLYH